MRRSALIVLLTVAFVLCVSGQEYKTGIGLRGGFSQGLTLKHFVDKKAAFEGILATRWRGVDLTGLYEIHNRAFEVDHLNWYYGFGAHIGSYDSTNAPWGTSGLILGIDGIIGIEYTFTEAPINIGIDWKPSFNLVGNSQFWGDGGALSIRYVF
jgi:hypothetical protein